MSYTPVELRHVRVGRRLLGYHRATVEKLLEEVAASFETVWRDRADLADRVEELEKELEQAREREHALANTLVTAERAADDLREQAKREADLILGEAHAEARSILRRAHAERERVFGEVRRVEALLRAALGMVEEAAPGEGAAEPAEEPAGTQAREAARRGDTSELPVTAAEPPQAQEPARLEPVPERPESEPEPEAKEEQDPGRPWPALKQVAKGGTGFDWSE